MRFAIQHRNKAKSERGRVQQKQPHPRFAKDTVVKLLCRNSQNALNEDIKGKHQLYTMAFSLSESSHNFLLGCSVEDLCLVFFRALDLATHMTTGVHVDIISTCFFTCENRASERCQLYQSKKKHCWSF